MLLIPVSQVPTGSKAKRDRGRIVLAYGEVTGHAHAIASKEAELIETEPGTDGLIADRFLRVLSEAGVDLVHEEHATITLPRGNYIVRIQREYAPEALRNVAD